MCSCQLTLGYIWHRPLLYFWFSTLYGIFNTAYHHRYITPGLSGATDLETSYAQLTQNHSNCVICFRYLVCCFPLHVPPPRVRRQGVNLEVGLLADECSEFSVTLASIIRLIYLIKYRISLDPSIDYVKVYIWTSVEVKISIVHGT